MTILIIFVSHRDVVDVLEEDQLDSNDVLAIVQTHCVSCHAANPLHKDFVKAPGGVKLETIDDIKKYGSQIMKQSVLTNAMPLVNETQMTNKERQGVGDWIRRGMPVDE